ncbi:MAG: hypothetical protein GY696_15290 [Gammaproteobacteria bacterium]|nr:hypothetical protein [Gammaproteobacteria bacterium]
MTREQAMKDLDRGWLQDWGDMLTCIILCLLESATRAGVAFGKGLRVARRTVQHLLEKRRQPREREEEREAVL